MTKESINKRLSIVFNDSKPINDIEFSYYYDYVVKLAYGSYNAGIARKSLKQIDDYMEQWADEYNKHTYGAYSDCPKDVKKEITRLIGVILTAYCEYIITREIDEYLLNL